MEGLGVTGGSLYFLTENSAMIYTTTTNTSLIVCLCPLFAALFAALFFRSQRLHGIQIVGSVMAAIGVVIVVLNGHFVLHLSPLVAIGRLAGLCRLPLLGSLFATDDTSHQTLRHFVHHSQSVLLWAALDGSLLPFPA